MVHLDSKIYFIEVHGEQHYKSTTGAWKSQSEQALIDRCKKELVLKNNCGYIEIDFRKSTLEWGKETILKSQLSEIFDLSDINWLQAHKKSLKSLVVTVCEEYNKKLLTSTELAEKFNISYSTVLTYLKQGSKINICDYQTPSQKAQQMQDTILKLYNTNKLRVSEIADILNVKEETITKYLKEASKNGYCNYKTQYEKFHIKIKKVCKLYNENKNINQICLELDLQRHNVIRYLKKGSKMNLCVYVPENESKEKLKQDRKKRVLEACKIFNQGLSKKDISKKMNLAECVILRYLQEGVKKGICSYNSDTRIYLSCYKNDEFIGYFKGYDSIVIYVKKKFNCDLNAKGLQSVASGRFKTHFGFSCYKLKTEEVDKIDENLIIDYKKEEII